jgi:4-hydroxy-tetrahydrodipicolinate synthase
MKRTNLKGTYTALITPFNDDLSVDFDALDRLVDNQLAANIDGLVVLGSTAEAQTLSMKEKVAIILKIQEKVNGRVPIIVGTGSNDTRATIEFTMFANEHNFDGVLLVAPYYNKPSQEGLYQHFLAISESIDISMIVYNVPSRTGINVLPETVQRIAESCKNVIGIKESSGDVEQIMDVIRLTPREFITMCGDDSLGVPTIFMGAMGVVSVLSNYAPKRFGDCVRFAMQRNITETNKLHYELFDLMKINFIETNPVPVKAIMKELGFIKNHLVRMPLVPITIENLDLIKKVLSGKQII